MQNKNMVLAACAATLFIGTSAMAQVTPVINKSFNPTIIGLNGTSTVSFVITNTIVLPGVSFTDTLPPGLVVANPANVTTQAGTCTVPPVVTAVPGSSTISVAPFAMQDVFGCVIRVNVTATTLGLKTNSVTVTDTRVGDGNTSIAQLLVISAPTIIKSFAAATIGVGGTTTLVLTINNLTNAVPLTGLAFTDTFPATLRFADVPNLTGGCGGATVAAVGPPATLSLTGGTVAANTFCTITVNVTGTAAGPLNNVAGPISSTQTGTGATSNTATLLVLAPPTLTKTFGAANVNINGTTSLTFTVTNPNAGTAITGVAFTDTLPAGLAIDIPNGLTSNCGGTLAAVGGTNAISLTGGSLAAGASCTFSVNVFGLANGTQVNTTSTITSTNAGTGLAATATLVINAIIDPEEAFQVSYAANLPVGDSVFNFTNTGTLTIPGNSLTTTGNICVNVYAFDASEELISCCSCLVTPNGLNSVSARADLISNTLTPGVPTSIVVKLVATRPLGLTPAGTGGTCNASSPTPLTVTPGMRAWGTTLHALPTTPVQYGVTETPFQTAPLGVAELTKLTTFCGFIQANGSGFGICKSCRTGGLGANSK